MRETGYVSHNCILFTMLFNICSTQRLILDFTCFQVFSKLVLEITLNFAISIAENTSYEIY